MCTSKKTRSRTRGCQTSSPGRATELLRTLIIPRLQQPWSNQDFPQLLLEAAMDGTPQGLKYRISLRTTLLSRRMRPITLSRRDCAVLHSAVIQEIKSTGGLLNGEI